MTKNDFINLLKQAFDNSTLMTSKHDPNNLGSLNIPSYRTVLSYDIAAELINFILSGKYDVIEYVNTNPAHPPEYYEIIPTDPLFSVPASGVSAYSSQPISALDRIIAVSGAAQGIHLFGEDSANINRKLSLGKLRRKGTLI